MYIIIFVCSQMYCYEYMCNAVTKTKCGSFTKPERILAKIRKMFSTLKIIGIRIFGTFRIETGRISMTSDTRSLWLIMLRI